MREGEPKRDYYEVLEVPRTAELPAIRSAFRKLARDCHPDVNPDPGAEARFKECAEAWEVLSHSEKRAAYDRHGFVGLRGRPMPDFQDAAFRDLYNSHFGTDEYGMEMHPVFMYQKYLREYLKQRKAKSAASDAQQDRPSGA